MVVLPAGSVFMGSPPHESRRGSDEGPQRRIQFNRPFAIGRYEVTVAEFGAFLAQSGYPVDSTCEGLGYVTLPGPSEARWRDHGFPLRERDPISCARWNDAVAYAAWLSRKTGKTYRLPSEAEWEYAARAGAATARFWGDRIGRNRANCDGCGSRWDNRRTSPVGSFEPNGFGLYDILGNNWEWVQDCYEPRISHIPPNGGAFVGGACKERVMRGGSFESDPNRLRSANRNMHRADEIDDDFGFRLVREIKDEAPPRPAPPAPVQATLPKVPEPVAPAPAPAPEALSPKAPESAATFAAPQAPKPEPATSATMPSPPPPPPIPPVPPASVSRSGDSGASEELEELPELPPLPPLED